MFQTIDGAIFRKMLIGGAAVLSRHVNELNDLNVFPVSDGDTGSNMLKTVEGGLAQTERDSGIIGIGEISSLFAEGALLSARGNSGVILSQIFAGIRDGLSGLENVGAAEIGKAYRLGIERSYSAVRNPVEGTILTVFRESTEYALKKTDEKSSVSDFFAYHLEEAKRSLASTPELLDVLKKSGVVDSGAAGYMYMAEGMNDVLEGKENVDAVTVSSKEKAVDIGLFTRDSVLEFGYCTEFLLRLTSAKVDVDAFDIKTVISDLDELKGESVVAYKQGDIVKAHVHTFAPGRILDRMQSYGEFLTVKIENMMLGHNETVERKPAADKPYAVVATASGEGIARLFKELGADCILRQDSPSAEDFLKAYRACGCSAIIVLPNNKNFIPVAKQAASMIPERDIRVIETRSCSQGYSAVSVLTPGIEDIEALEESAKRAAENVLDGEVTKAARDAEIGGVAIKKGDYIARSGGNLKAVEKSAEDAVLKFLEEDVTEMVELITLFKGINVSDENADCLSGEINRRYPDCELTVYDGGQSVYDYYIALE